MQTFGRTPGTLFAAMNAITSAFDSNQLLISSPDSNSM